MNDDQVLKLDFENWPLPNAYLAELGRLAAMWSSLEGQLDLYLGKIAGFDDLSDPRAFILLKHSAFPQKLDSLAALCDHLAQQYPNLAEYASTIGRLKSAQRPRPSDKASQAD